MEDIRESPKQAATKYLRNLEKKEVQPEHFTIYLKESTRNGSRKIYGFEVSKIKYLNNEEENIFNYEIKEIPIIIE